MRRLDESAFTALKTLLRRNQRRYGGYIVHAGVVILFLGISGAAFNEEKIVNVRPGDWTVAARFPLPLPHGRRDPGPALRRRQGAARALPRRRSARGDDAGEAALLARAAAELDPVDLLELARGPLRDPDGARARRLGHAQDLSQPARELGLGGRRDLRAGLPDRAMAASRARGARRRIRCGRTTALAAHLAPPASVHRARRAHARGRSR